MKIQIGKQYRLINCVLPENDGQIVTVVELVGCYLFGPSRTLANGYRIDKSLPTTCGQWETIVAEYNLEETPDKPALTTWESLSHIWVPSEPVETQNA